MSPSPQTRRGSDSEKRSLDSRGEAAGSGRAIPIKQVSGGGTQRCPGCPLPVPVTVPLSPELPAEAQRQLPQQGVEEEICHLVQQRAPVLPPQHQRECPRPLRCPRGTEGTSLWAVPPQDYIHSTHGKEMDLLRTTVKVPGKRPPRAISACGPAASVNGLLRDVGTAPEGGGEDGAPAGGGSAVTPVSPRPSPPAAVGLSLPPEPGTKATGKGSLQRCASASSAKLSPGECHRPWRAPAWGPATPLGLSRGPGLRCPR